ncbi:MAG: SRPBCC family protein [Marinobacter sp.]|uniref:SRPBCC family protein n=1 Tax=Marinobacter sp. TaxID=50741 RepID=UPI0034A0A24F
MQTIVVKRTIAAPIDQVFELLSDHAGYSAFAGIKDARLLKAGLDDPNGNGAVRRIDLGAVWFEEEISNFQRPTTMDYKILRSRPPMQHQSGQIRLQQIPEGTAVTWTSVFRVSIPVIGLVLSPLAAHAGEKAFGSILKTIDRKLTGKAKR